MILDLEKLIDKYKLDINGVLHIGANIGNEYELYSRLDISPMIFVEPLSHLYKELLNTTKNDERCITIQKAAGDESKTVTMFTETNGNRGSSSVLKPTKHLTQYPHIDISGREEVNQIRIDDLDIPQTNFINIDIQGYELNALKGSEKYLENVDYIISEVNKEELYESCTLVEELDLYLSSFGFKRVETDWGGGSWGDGFYIKEMIQ